MKNDIHISINVSPKNFIRRSFLEEFLSKVKSLDINPRLLNVEIIERMFINDVKTAKFILTSLKNSGFKVSIDDFGTGYSSLSYLISIPVDAIKIDISFIRRLPKDNNAFAIVSAIANLCKNLKLETIAEGVETEKQLKVLEELGVNAIQGYYFSKPVPFEEFEAIVDYV